MKSYDTFIQRPHRLQCLLLLFKCRRKITLHFRMRIIPVLCRYVVVVIILVLSSIDNKKIVNAFVSSKVHNNRLITQQQATSVRDIHEKKKVLVLGGTGFVGKHVIDRLKQKDIPYIATSTNGRDDTIAFNITDDNASKHLLDINQTNDIGTIVSTIGCIFTNHDDYIVNAASGQTATDAFKDESSKPKFIFIGNTPRVRNVCNIIPALNEYARGKEESELLLEQTFGQNVCIIKPTFIYGGTKFATSPPRIPSFLGEVIEAVLGLYPIQWVAEVLPDILGVVLEAPVNVQAVSNAIVNEAIGLCDNQVLDTREDIIMAASKRPSISSSDNNKLLVKEMDAQRDELKTILSTKASEYTNEQNFAMLEELEQLKPTSMRPTEDSLLDGRWDFCFEVEPDVETGFIKEMFEGDEPNWAKKILDFVGVHMEIGNEQSTIQLVVSVKVLEKDITVILHTSLTTAEKYEGTMLREKFEGIEVNGFRLPYPNVWKKSRYLEFSYLDGQFAIARGSGGEPHFLLRGG